MSDGVTALDQAIDDYLEHLRVERNLAKNTLDAYGRDLSDFAAAMIDAGIDTPRKVGTEHIAGWVRALADSGLKARSQGRMLVAVRGLFRHLLRNEVLTDDPSRLVDLPRAGRTLPRTVAYDEVLALLRHAGASTRDRALVLLLYGGGLRVSEVVTLELGSMFLDSGIVRVLGKGKKERVIPIGTPVIDALREYMRDHRSRVLRGRTSELLFPGRGLRRPLTRQAVFAILRRLARKAGLNQDISPHKLRHGFATDLVQGGADLRSVQVMLGHADLRTTEIYTHVDDQHLRRTYDKTHPRR